MEELQIVKVSCNRCGHEWTPRINPVMCPKCKSYHWNKHINYDERKTKFKTESKSLMKGGTS